MFLKLTQCTIDHLCHLGLRVLLLHTVRDTSVDIRHFQALDTIVGDVGHQFNVVDVKLSVFLAFGIYLAEQFYFLVIEMLAHLSTIQMLRKNSARRLPFLTTVSRIMLRWV